jgi:hypothetical protein
MITSLNSIYPKSFSFLSFRMEKFQESAFDWEILSCHSYSDSFVRFLKSPAMLTCTSSTNSESFIHFGESRCKVWNALERITHDTYVRRSVRCTRIGYQSFCYIQSLLRSTDWVNRRRKFIRNQP